MGAVIKVYDVPLFSQPSSTRVLGLKNRLDDQVPLVVSGQV